MTEQTAELIFLKSSRRRRFAAFAIDHYIITCLMISIVFIAVGEDFVNENNPDKMFTIIMLVMIPWLFLYFAKDSLKGISIGKWMMGIKVRDESNQNKIPSFGRLFLRNLLIVIWPVEFIVLATSDQKKRFGDRIAKTVVVKNIDKPKKLPRILAIIGFGIVFFVFVFFTVAGAVKNSDAYKTAITEIEKDAQIISETGGIKGYGMFPAGNISISNGEGQAQLEIKVLGNKRNVNVGVYLEKEPEGKWKLMEMLNMSSD